MTRYEIQERRTVRSETGASRGIVKLDTADDRAVAFAIAEVMAADRLTVWVFEKDLRPGGAPGYRLLGTVPAGKR